MKKILITGANSYIGTQFETYLAKWPDKYQVDTIDMIDGTWRNKSFKGYDVVFHVAGIVHQKEKKECRELYQKVNGELPFEVAKKAKKEGVKQFIFLSSMSVYGKDIGVINKNTMPKPKTYYGKSKLHAEELLSVFEGNDFKVCVLRPPMVYGKGCRGNYNSIIKIVKCFSFFPKIKNKRSMIHVLNLSAFLKKAVDNELNGLFFPQNSRYVSTYELANQIASEMNKKIHMSYLLGFFVICMFPFSKKVRKAFGNLTYEGTDDFDFDYCVR